MSEFFAGPLSSFNACLWKGSLHLSWCPESLSLEELPLVDSKPYPSAGVLPEGCVVTRAGQARELPCWYPAGHPCLPPLGTGPRHCLPGPWPSPWSHCSPLQLTSSGIRSLSSPNRGLLFAKSLLSQAFTDQQTLTMKVLKFFYFSLSWTSCYLSASKLPLTSV